MSKRDVYDTNQTVTISLFELLRLIQCDTIPEIQDKFYTSTYNQSNMIMARTDISREHITDQEAGWRSCRLSSKLFIWVSKNLAIHKFRTKQSATDCRNSAILHRVSRSGAGGRRSVAYRSGWAWPSRIGTSGPARWLGEGALPPLDMCRPGPTCGTFPGGRWSSSSWS